MSIENDRVNQILMRAYLEDEMFCQHFFGVNTGAQALAHFERAISEPELALPDLVFLDLGMQDMGAWEFISAIEKLAARLRKIPSLILVAVAASDADRARARQHALVLELVSRPLSSGCLTRLRADPRYQRLFPASDSLRKAM